MYADQKQKTSQTLTVANREVINKIRDSLLSSIANDLTFLYDDGKTFFTDDTIAEGFLKFVNDSSYDITTPNGFENVVKNANSYPQEITKDGVKIPNPEYYAAQITKSLDATFEVMAEDILTAFGDNLGPALRQIVAEKISTTDKAYGEFLKKIFEKLNTLIDEKTGLIKSLPTSYKKTLKENIFRNRFLDKVLRKFKRYFSMHEVQKRIEYDNDLSQLHPLILKLMKKGNRRCEYFKSFILSYDMCEQLYRVKYLVDTEKFLAGVNKQPPRKLNNPMNRLDTVLGEYLGLKDNPTWIVSRQNVYLSMPDDFSLTRTGIMSKIPKSDLMEVCRIKAADYWNQQTMGKVAQLGNKKIAEMYRRIDKLRGEISDLEKKKLGETDAKKKKNIERDIRSKNSQIEKIEDQISKMKQEEKAYHPNAFIFGNEEDFDDPNKAEKNELLSDAEKTDLKQSRDKMKEGLLNLNPYDDNQVDELEKQMRKIRETHPFDFEEDEDEREKERSREEETREVNNDVLSELERLLKEREEREKKENRF
jgi:hypothetical protein